MFKNYLKIALRTLKKNKVYTAINVLGLAVGIACCLLIMLFVQDELSYDKFNKHYQRIYRGEVYIDYGDNHFRSAITPAPLAGTLLLEYPGIAAAARIVKSGSWTVKNAEDHSGSSFREERIAFADASLLDVFTIPLVAGNPKEALNDPNSLIISEKMAHKYFGNENPVGKILLLDNAETFKITGVFRDIPRASHFHYDFFISMEYLEDSKNNSWLRNDYNTYVLLREGTDVQALENKFSGLVHKYVAPQAQRFVGLSGQEIEKRIDTIWDFTLRPLTDIHLYADLNGELEPNSDIKYIYIFSSIGIFILSIACINFMNLATARSAKRAKEVGIRKTLGSNQKQLVLQFLTEAMLIAALSVVIAIVLVEFFLPAFNQLSGKVLRMNYADNPLLLFFSLGIIAFTGLAAGSYPSVFLSSFKPVTVLKGNYVRSGPTYSRFRSCLVVFQFSVSIILMIGTAVIYEQLSYIRHKKLGFNKEQVVVIEDAYLLGNQLPSYKSRLLDHSGITYASISGFLPVNSSRWDMPMWPVGNTNKESMVSMQYWSVDEDYIPTFGMEIIRGRNFSADFLSDSSAVIINQAAAARLGFKDPIGKRIYRKDLNVGDGNENERNEYTIIGVVKDFHFESLRSNISPLCMRLAESRGYLSVRMNAGNTRETLAYLQDQWGKIAAGQPFSYSFLDERFEAMYRAEQKTGKIYGAFAFVAIFIACLGLFGLAAFTAEQRTKEIGVRKIMGASVRDIIVLLSRQFSLLVGVAFLIAVPVSWFVMDRWLENFAYRTVMGMGVFILAGGLALLIAWLTMSYQSIKAALANPVDSLKSE